MTVQTELLVTVQRDRERAIARDRLARIAAGVRSCRPSSIIDRVARTLRLAPATC